MQYLFTSYDNTDSKIIIFSLSRLQKTTTI